LALALPFFGFLGDVVEVVEHQQRALQALGGDGADRGVVEQVDQRLDVVAAEHGAEEFGGLLARNERAGFLALGDFRQEGGLDLGGVIHAGRHAVGEEVDQEGLFARFCQLLRVLQQIDEFPGLLGSEGQRRDAEGSALGGMGTVGF
jgi:hypothetical protein